MSSSIAFRRPLAFPFADLSSKGGGARGGDGGAQVVVAVIDSGCDLWHEDLKNKMWINLGEASASGGNGCYDGIDNDGNGYIDDCWGWVSGNCIRYNTV